uniref:ChlI component of cobalt chelatase involved in B12 biosynthesis / ChlD component of cobalt chelatase involved in B12 biosynthesis n=1 Tax=Nonomuraea gerenzanensis TaxID=93944 RepID=A0A1M4EAQ1_9ACTN|nr:ChlI component of cobalt chelatase involved in B12 biosynthesis / ChlD component of cobalt chelatase involved in B12 biosynthesis [Nonomuraea gerenzanensis]
MAGPGTPRTLACAALEPGLDGVLLFDAAPAALSLAAGLLAKLMGEPRVVTLAAYQSEDDLWTSLRLRTSGFEPGPGPLVQGEGTAELLVVVPDLARVGLPGQRALITLLDAPVAVLERHGYHRAWAPRLRCLAACDTAEVGTVPPHLLDRFPVRATAAGLTGRSDSLSRVLHVWGTAPESAAPSGTGAVPQEWLDAARRARPWPAFGSRAAALIVGMVPADRPRRMLAAARLARGYAALDGAEQVEERHVEEAARLLGFGRTGGRDTPAPARPDDGTASRPDDEGAREGVDRPPAPDAGADAGRAAGAAAGETAGTAAQPLAVQAPQAAIAFGAEETPLPPGTGYPEDEAEPLREIAPLRAPPVAAVGPARRRGPPIGLEPATDLADLAMVATLREAAKFQRVRQANTGTTGRFLINPADLRTHRRQQEPEHLLGLVLDHTCRRGWDWTVALTSHLRWAYVHRAGVVVVDVGAGDAAAELRAERFTARRVLDRRVTASLSRPRGRATPLAHGLSLAHAGLRHAMQHGRAAVSRAWLVVVTDALGNVPLAAGLQDTTAGSWSGEGVTDAVAIARELATLRRLRIVVAAPPDPPHPELVLGLADALGAGLLGIGGADADVAEAGHGH